MSKTLFKAKISTIAADLAMDCATNRETIIGNLMQEYGVEERKQVEIEVCNKCGYTKPLDSEEWEYVGDLSRFFGDNIKIKKSLCPDCKFELLIDK